MSQGRQLDRSLVSGILWTAAFRWPGQLLSWIATAFAARVLTPADYGIISIAMIAVGLVRLVEDFGMDSVLIQDRSIVGVQQARLAGLVIGVGVVLAALLAALSHPIAAFFDEPMVAPVIMVLSLLCVADSIQVVSRAGLQRDLKYGRLAIAQFVQIAVTQAVLVAGALAGWGVWALASSTLAGSFAVTMLVLVWHPYSVSWPRELAKLAHPLLQGWRILASRAAYYAYNTADQTVVGKMLGKEALGAYSFSTTFSTTISTEITSVVSRVVPGVFSEVQHRPDELRRYFLILTELLAYLALPVSLGMAVTADLVVSIVLGPQWQAVIVPLQILCIYAAYYTSQVLVGPLLIWTGQFRANMWCSILVGVTLPIAMMVGARWGLEGIAWTWAVWFPLVNLPGMVIAFRTIHSGFGAWLNALWPALAASALMAVVVLAVRARLPVDLAAPLTATVAVAAGGLTYVAALLLFFRRRVLEMFEFARSLYARRGEKQGEPPALSGA